MMHAINSYLRTSATFVAKQKESVSFECSAALYDHHILCDKAVDAHAHAHARSVAMSSTVNAYANIPKI